MKIVSIVGKKNSGKTSLTTGVISELKKRGYTVASVKHSHHNIEMDKENTDTWRHKQAGSDIVVGVGSTTFFNVTSEFDLNRILYMIKHMSNVDFTIIEGFKKYNYPKIITSPDAADEYTICEVDSFKIDYDGISDLCDLIEEKGHDITDTLFINNCGYSDGEKISAGIRNGDIKTEDLDCVDSYLSVNDKVIGLNKFVSEYIKQTVIGIVNTLHIREYGVDDINKVELLINNEKYIKTHIVVNQNEIELNRFVENLVGNSIRGIVKSLKHDEEAKHIEIRVNSRTTLKINDKEIEINKFVCNILNESIAGILNTLKINEPADDILITVEERLYE